MRRVHTMLRSTPEQPGYIVDWARVQFYLHIHCCVISATNRLSALFDSIKSKVNQFVNFVIRLYILNANVVHSILWARM